MKELILRLQNISEVLKDQANRLDYVATLLHQVELEVENQDEKYKRWIANLELQFASAKTRIAELERELDSANKTVSRVPDPPGDLF